MARYSLMENGLLTRFSAKKKAGCGERTITRSFLAKKGGEKALFLFSFFSKNGSSIPFIFGEKNGFSG